MSVNLCNLPTIIVLFSACALIVLGVVSAWIEGFQSEKVVTPTEPAKTIDVGAVPAGSGWMGYLFGPFLSFLGDRRWGGYMIAGCLLMALPQYAKLPGSDAVCPVSAAPLKPAAVLQLDGLPGTVIGSRREDRG